MILELDIGNSRIKWRQLHAGDGADDVAGPAVDNDSLIDELSTIQPADVRLCSVRDASVTRTIRQWSRSSFAVDPSVAEVVRNCGGVTVQYADLSRLGVDRWLAMLSAYQRAGGPCVIVDAGTAVTLDIVAADGLHQGGYIVPGVKLMAASLEQNTGIRLLDATDSASMLPGNSTEAAVFNGNLTALVSLVQRVLSSVEGQEPQAKLYISGGDAELLAPQINFARTELVSTLVLDGLAIACPLEEGES